MKFTMDFDMDNDAFIDEDGISLDTVAHVIHKVKVKVNEGDFHPGHTKSILDINGNRIGSWRIGE